MQSNNFPGTHRLYLFYSPFIFYIANACEDSSRIIALLLEALRQWVHLHLTCHTKRLILKTKECVK